MNIELFERNNVIWYLEEEANGNMIRTLTKRRLTEVGKIDERNDIISWKIPKIYHLRNDGYKML